MPVVPDIKAIKETITGIFKKEKKVGLALGGGAARGIAHVGVLKILEQYKIPIHYIAGTSSGALYGALYAGGMGIAAMEAASKRAGWSRLIRITLSHRGPVTGDLMEKLIIQSIGDVRFSDLRIPLNIVATDIQTGEEVILSSGSVAAAVHASSAVPGVFHPVRIGGKLLVDGMVVNNVPIETVKKMGADIVIAVDVIPKATLPREPAHAVEIVERALDLGLKKQNELVKSKADFFIEPVTEFISSLALYQAEALIRMGEEATLAVIDKIKEKL